VIVVVLRTGLSSWGDIGAAHSASTSDDAFRRFPQLIRFALVLLLSRALLPADSYRGWGVIKHRLCAFSAIV